MFAAAHSASVLEAVFKWRSESGRTANGNGTGPGNYLGPLLGRSLSLFRWRDHLRLLGPRLGRARCPRIDLRRIWLHVCCLGLGLWGLLLMLMDAVFGVEDLEAAFGVALLQERHFNLG